MSQSGKGGNGAVGAHMAGGSRRRTEVWNISLSHVIAGFLVRGQTSSFDSQASINICRKGRAWVVCPLNMLRGDIKRGRPSSVAQERVHLQEAQTENKKRGVCVNKWMDKCTIKRKKLSHN